MAKSCLSPPINTSETSRFDPYAPKARRKPCLADRPSSDSPLGGSPFGLVHHVHEKVARLGAHAHYRGLNAFETACQMWQEREETVGCCGLPFVQTRSAQPGGVLGLSELEEQQSQCRCNLSS